jgi:hypothetical protein
VSIATRARHHASTGSTRTPRRQQRRALRRCDRLGARLAELDAIQGLLADATDVVSSGWVQGAWFTVAQGGRTRAITAYDIGSAIDRPVSGACVVGAVVQAAGGPAAVRRQVVQRTLDVLWHALREDPQRPVRWCPGPHTRGLQVLELTFWNDAKGRSADDVAGLLRSASVSAAAEADRCRAERSVLAALAV